MGKRRRSRRPLKGEKPYCFMLDRNVEHLRDLFPRKRATTASEEGLPPNASDDEIVDHAWRRMATIVTSDRKDFVPAIQKFQKTKGGGMCPCLYGLIVLPNVHATQQRLLTKGLTDPEARLPSMENTRTTWSRVSRRNYKVLVMKSGTPVVTELGLMGQCGNCES